MFADAYRGRRVLVTGHTGFKGSWLALWLQQLGAEVHGLALEPDPPSHWELLGLEMPGEFADIRDATAVARTLQRVRPDIVFHLAAQSLVRSSYEDPLGTWSTNVMGTAHVLEACRQEPRPRAVVVVTSDKCYLNQEWHWGYREQDPLGGHDPYSASKAATEMVAASYRRSFFAADGAPLVATARAGNVIGGGDWSRDRLLPDVVRAMQAGQPVQVRHPEATRPWQHVLEPLAGYLRLGQLLLQGDASAADAWNFGPSGEGNRSVGWVLDRLATYWPGLSWQATQPGARHEATLLHVDSARARAILQWEPVWTTEQALAATADWYRAHLASGAVCSAAQLQRYVLDAASRGQPWAQP